MKPLLLLLAITMFPFSAFAADIESQINKACLRHAVSLVAKLKADVVGELSQTESEQALKIATDSCQAYFKKEFSENPDAVAAANTETNQEEDGGVKDWLTEKILSGDTERKKGNERLRTFKR